MRIFCFLFFHAFGRPFSHSFGNQLCRHLQIYWFTNDTVESSVARLAGLQLFSLFILSIGIFMLATTKSPMQECLAKDPGNIVRSRFPISTQFLSLILISRVV